MKVSSRKRVLSDHNDCVQEGENDILWATLSRIYQSFENLRKTCQLSVMYFCVCNSKALCLKQFLQGISKKTMWRGKKESILESDHEKKSSSIKYYVIINR